MHPPPVLLQELRRYDPLGAKIQPLVPAIMAYPALRRLLDNLLFHPRSTKCLQLSHPKRCAPNRGERLLGAAKLQNSDALTVQLNPMPSVALRQDYARRRREPLHAIAPSLMRSYHSVLSLVRWLPPWLHDKSQFLRNASRARPQRTDNLRPGNGDLPPETVLFPSARSGHLALHVLVQSRNCPKSRA